MQHHRRLSLQPHQETADLEPALQQPPSHPSKIVITAKNVDPLASFVKEIDVGSTVICYVSRNVVFSDEPDFFDTVNDVVHVRCSQSDVNFSMPLLCKPQQLPENCLVVWNIDEKIRRQAMWSSPENVDLDPEKPATGFKMPWFRGRVAQGRVSHPSSRGPVMTGPAVYRNSRSGSKKYQGRVPSIVALLTNHAKNQKVQKSGLPPDSPAPSTSVVRENHNSAEKGFWQQKRFNSVSKEIHKAMVVENNCHEDTRKVKLEAENQEICVKKQVELFEKERKLGFSYHLDPPTTSVSRPSVLHLPPPPQLPLPPVPEDQCLPVPGPSTRTDHEALGPTASNTRVPEAQAPSYKARKISESVTFVDPYTHKPEFEEGIPADTILTPHSEKQRRESTCLFLPDDVIKPEPVDKQKLSAVLVLSLFVASLIMFYLFYFL